MIPLRLDSNNATVVETELKTLLQTIPEKIILDFSETDYMDRAGLRVLLFISRDFTKSGGRIALTELKPSVLKIFDMAGVTKIFTICISSEGAMRKVAKTIIQPLLILCSSSAPS